MLSPLLFRRQTDLAHHDEAQQLAKLLRRLEDLGREGQEDRLPLLGVDQLFQDGLVLPELLVRDREEVDGDFSALAEVISEAAFSQAPDFVESCDAAQIFQLKKRNMLASTVFQTIIMVNIPTVITISFKLQCPIK